MILIAAPLFHDPFFSQSPSHFFFFPYSLLFLFFLTLDSHLPLVTSRFSLPSFGFCNPFFLRSPSHFFFFSLLLLFFRDPRHLSSFSLCHSFSTTSPPLLFKIYLIPCSELQPHHRSFLPFPPLFLNLLLSILIVCFHLSSPFIVSI